ncbi:hypothetical protein HAX54_007909 [Datura stramonium]|uniref:Uncharacterized protein n=1 Tax=Datura stramonium TaxID=4076 RepID=A0ABS8TE71_DATST|nr:hypothetical protein [Datura stramonium]
MVKGLKVSKLRDSIFLLRFIAKMETTRVIEGQSWMNEEFYEIGEMGLKVSKLRDSIFLLRFIAKMETTRVIEGQSWMNEEFYEIGEMVGGLCGGFVDLRCSMSDMSRDKGKQVFKSGFATKRFCTTAGQNTSSSDFDLGRVAWGAVRKVLRSSQNVLLMPEKVPQQVGVAGSSLKFIKVW